MKLTKQQRSEAAKKDWRTRRRRGVEIRVGYNGSVGNSYTMVVRIKPYKRLSDQSIANLVEKLARRGHFDGDIAELDEAPRDLNWIAPNAYLVTKRHLVRKRGTAKMIDFLRESPI